MQNDQEICMSLAAMVTLGKVTPWTRLLELSLAVSIRTISMEKYTQPAARLPASFPYHPPLSAGVMPYRQMALKLILNWVPRFLQAT